MQMLRSRAEGSRLERWIESGEFRFDRLVIRGIDNVPVADFFGPGVLEPETCLFHGGVAGGDDYVDLLHARIAAGIEGRRAMPVARFADGEYAFYDGSLKCNGLYRQAESVEAIRKALPSHVEDLKYLAANGLIAPVIYPGNVVRNRKGMLSFLKKASGDDSARKFLDFLEENGVELSRHNYVPFFAVYAYLTSPRFSRAVDKRKVCILNSDVNLDACARWFGRVASRPELAAVSMPDSYVATRWASMREGVLARVPADSDLFLVGAGVGALNVCADLSRRFSIPAVDAGHVLNLMNDLENKSAGPRLYTIHR
jgi:hypothetical protein